MVLQIVFKRIIIWIKAFLQLPGRDLFHYAGYMIGFKSGFYRIKAWISLRKPIPSNWSVSPNFLDLPDLAKFFSMFEREKKDLIEEADEICNGKIRLFGGPYVENSVTQVVSLESWWKIENQIHFNPEHDPKFIWEPARFDWVYTLIRAYRLTGNRKYAEYFWHTASQFMRHNPPYSGPNWSSGQEVALRLIAFLSAIQAFGKSDEQTLDWNRWQTYLLYHARRIPITFRYAMAQNNNHLISEALGLFLAGCAFRNQPEALTWKKMGWYWLSWAFVNQIEDDGTYPQHSTNYHRLVLQAGLLAISAAKKEDLKIPERLLKKYRSATSWIMEYVDPASGKVPNLGPNDGAYILPLASGGFDDYRSTIQAALRICGLNPMFPTGPWDELSLWLGLEIQPEGGSLSTPQVKVNPKIISDQSWISVRSRKFKTRPGHADLLHVDLWWRGQAITLDAGTYRYSASPPWNNSLASSRVHNTVTIEGKDQMLRAGRFLWLDWAEAHCEISRSKIHAWHNGYRSLGIRHDRWVTCPARNQYIVEDRISGRNLNEPSPVVYLHWLLPDFGFEIDSQHIRIYPHFGGCVDLQIQSINPKTQIISISIIRAGEVIRGNKNLDYPIQGWYSPTYSIKIPALSVYAEIRGSFPLQFRSEWYLEDIKERVLNSEKSEMELLTNLLDELE